MCTSSARNSFLNLFKIYILFASSSARLNYARLDSISSGWIHRQILSPRKKSQSKITSPLYVLQELLRYDPVKGAGRWAAPGSPGSRTAFVFSFHLCFPNPLSLLVFTSLFLSHRLRQDPEKKRYHMTMTKWKCWPLIVNCTKTNNVKYFMWFLEC